MKKITLGIMLLSTIFIFQSNKTVSAESIMLQTTDTIHITNETQQAKVTAFFNSLFANEETNKSVETTKEENNVSQGVSSSKNSDGETYTEVSSSNQNNNHVTTPQPKPEPESKLESKPEPEPESIPDPEPIPQPEVIYPNAPTSIPVGYFASMDEGLSWGAYNFPEGATNYQVYTAGFLQNGTPYYGVDYYYGN